MSPRRRSATPHPAGRRQYRVPAPTQPLDPLSFGSERVAKRNQVITISQTISTCYDGFLIWNQIRVERNRSEPSTSSAAHFPLGFFALGAVSDILSVLLASP